MVDRSAGLDLARYENLTEAPRELVADVLSATHDTYVASLEYLGEEPNRKNYDLLKREPRCTLIAPILAERLNEMSKDYRARSLDVRFGAMLHVITGIKTPDMAGFILADANWQQFLSRREYEFDATQEISQKNTRPDVLIGTPAEVARVALKFGFTEQQASTWGSIEITGLQE